MDGMAKLLDMLKGGRRSRRRSAKGTKQRKSLRTRTRRR